MTMRRSFALNRRSVAASRQFVLAAIPNQSDELREAAILMVSELATNAIVHAATGFEVSVDLSADALTIGVTDMGAGEPELRSPPASDEHGRGLLIVQELSDEWGMFDNQDHSGKTVWCTVRLAGEDQSERREASTREDTHASSRSPQTSRRQTRETARSKAAGKGASPQSPKAKGSECPVLRQRQNRPCGQAQLRSFAFAAVNSSSVKRP
jgi:anti-sigma regulatory factor (Ser/Thr protein kinase)